LLLEDVGEGLAVLEGRLSWVVEQEQLAEFAAGAEAAQDKGGVACGRVDALG